MHSLKAINITPIHHFFRIGAKFSQRLCFFVFSQALLYLPTYALPWQWLNLLNSFRRKSQKLAATCCIPQRFCIDYCHSAAERFKTVVFHIAFTALQDMAISSRFLVGSERLQRLDLEMSDRVYERLMRLSSSIGRSMEELAAELISQSVHAPL